MMTSPTFWVAVLTVLCGSLVPALMFARKARLPKQERPVRHANGTSKSARAWDHRPDHSFLLTSLPRELRVARRSARVRVGPDVIVVPTSRSAQQGVPGIELALELGRNLGALVLILPSGDATEVPFQRMVPPEQLPDLLVIDMATVDPRWWISDVLIGSEPSGYDVAAKRNFAISLARLFGWGQILFLDDDMIGSSRSDGLNAATVDFASRWMRREGRKAVGWTCAEFPDNSVVCHARRLAGLVQQTFIGGGALLIQVDADTPYFPDTYNEDWFFLIALAARAENRFAVLGRAGAVTQVEYDPYVPRRVEREEMGDILAECLMNLLEDGSLSSAEHSPAMSHDFWRRALRTRARQISGIRGTLLLFTAVKFGRGRSRRDRAIVALRLAETLHPRMSPSILLDWVRAWFERQAQWSQHLSAIRPLASGHEPRLVIEKIRTGLPPYLSARPPRSGVREEVKTGRISQRGLSINLGRFASSRGRRRTT